MRALCLTATGGPEHLALLEVPAPGITRGDQVRVGIRAIALNHLDLWVARGIPAVPIRDFPHIVAADGAGIVLETGPDVTGLAPGDRVVINPGVSCGACPACRDHQEVFCRHFGVLGEHLPGTAAEEIVLPARNLRPITGEWSWPEAAAFTLSTITAWRMLTTRADLRPGELVLIWGIGGGVAVAALQIARERGARVAVTSASDEKLQRARSLGAELGIRHDAGSDVVAAFKQHFGRKADVVIDSVGTPTWERSLRVLTPGGRLLCCGATGGHDVAIDLRRLFWFQWSLLGSTMGTSTEFAEVVALGDQGKFRPPIDRVYRWDEAALAYQRLETHQQFGKIALEG
jgi:NADPH:quinone reductase-like Zn-dependent oxidoreductase